MSFLNKFKSQSSAENTSVDSSVNSGENPYLTARRTWNDHVSGVVASRQTWQVVGISAMLITLLSVGGIIHIGSQSKFVPYVVEVDKLGQAAAVAPAQLAKTVDQRVVLAAVSSFIADARLVTPDVALQRQAIFRLYSMLSPKEPATQKMNEWLNGSDVSNPFKRAEKELVNTEIISVLPQTPNTWQVDWMETVRDRTGAKVGAPYRMRAILNVFNVNPTSDTPEAQMRNNPLGIYIRDYSWSKLELVKTR